jgi:hypothetical protein
MKGYCTINSDASVNPATGEAGYALWINCDLVTVKMKQLKDCVLKCRVFLIGIFPLIMRRTYGGTWI